MKAGNRSTLEVVQHRSTGARVGPKSDSVLLTGVCRMEYRIEKWHDFAVWCT
jgi:hypothetical protein